MCRDCLYNEDEICQLTGFDIDDDEDECENYQPKNEREGKCA